VACSPQVASRGLLAVADLAFHNHNSGVAGSRRRSHYYTLDHSVDLACCHTAGYAHRHHCCCHTLGLVVCCHIVDCYRYRYRYRRSHLREVYCCCSGRLGGGLARGVVGEVCLCAVLVVATTMSRLQGQGERRPIEV
jgi:hypothetical protein